ncbi:MAG: hypothetical protein M4579_000981 [Chaenotheca gracillima]|nr:MAG: hypothetical protein M4579_000981 [Chaenotheca gracillima]
MDHDLRSQGGDLDAHVETVTQQEDLEAVPIFVPPFTQGPAFPDQPLYAAPPSTGLLSQELPFHTWNNVPAPEQAPTPPPSLYESQGHQPTPTTEGLPRHVKPSKDIPHDIYMSRSHVCSYLLSNGDICSKRFARKSDLGRHERIHNDERLYGCEDCKKSFIQRSALTVHKRTHTGEKPHWCRFPECVRKFSDSSSLARHRHTHEPKPICPSGAPIQNDPRRESFSQTHRRSSHQVSPTFDQMESHLRQSYSHQSHPPHTNAYELYGQEGFPMTSATPSIQHPLMSTQWTGPNWEEPQQAYPAFLNITQDLHRQPTHMAPTLAQPDTLNHGINMMQLPYDLATHVQIEEPPILEFPQPNYDIDSSDSLNIEVHGVSQQYQSQPPDSFDYAQGPDTPRIENTVVPSSSGGFCSSPDGYESMIVAFNPYDFYDNKDSDMIEEALNEQ